MELSVRDIIIPLTDSLIISFCRYMKYEFIKEIDGISYFKIPHKKLCRLHADAASWKAGIKSSDRLL